MEFPTSAEKNKDPARVEHPRVCSIPPLRQKKGARVGHGSVITNSGYEFRWSARFSTVSRAAFCCSYSARSMVPESFWLSSEKSSSLRALSSAALPLAAAGAGAKGTAG